MKLNRIIVLILHAGADATVGTCLEEKGGDAKQDLM